MNQTHSNKSVEDVIITLNFKLKLNQILLSLSLLECLWKVCSWHLEKEKIKNAIAKNRIPEIKSKINSDRMIALLNMNRF